MLWFRARNPAYPAARDPAYPVNLFILFAIYARDPAIKFTFFLTWTKIQIEKKPSERDNVVISRYKSLECTMAKAEKDKEIIPYIRIDDRIDAALLDSRRLFLSDAVDNETAENVIRKLWYLEISNPGKPITLVINSPGGSVDSGFAIWDQIKMITSPVTTLVTGLAASMGSVLSLSASPKRRFATPNARIMIHQPMIGGIIQGQATDLDIQAREMIKTRNQLIQLYVDATGKDFQVIERAIDRDTWMTAKEALEFGLLDGIVNSYKDL